MSDDHAIHVNFDRAVPLFPLDAVSLFPYQLIPIHVFEPRYRQMVERCIDGAGQIGMSVFKGSDWRQQYHGRPPLREAVCLGQIVEHEKLPDGRFNILLQGVLRARIVKELPANEDRLYREAILAPIESHDDEEVEVEYDGLRERLEELFSVGPLAQVRIAQPLLEHIRNDAVPPQALLELLSFTMVSDTNLRYALLSEASASQRAALVEQELDHVAGLILRAAMQRPEDWPKGCSWN